MTCVKNGRFDNQKTGSIEAKGITFKSSRFYIAMPVTVSGHLQVIHFSGFRQCIQMEVI